MGFITTHGVLRRADYFRIGVVIVISLVVYRNALDAHILFDDHHALRHNQDSFANSTDGLGGLLRHDFWGQNLNAVSSNGSFRPFTILTFRIQNWLNGFTHSVPLLRAANLCISLLNGVLVYRLARITLPVEVGRDRLDGMYPAVAMLLFMVHPVHTEAVLPVVGRADLLSTCFGLCAFLTTHLFLAHAGNGHNDGGNRNSHHHHHHSNHHHNNNNNQHNPNSSSDKTCSGSGHKNTNCSNGRDAGSFTSCVRKGDANNGRLSKRGRWWRKGFYLYPVFLFCLSPFLLALSALSKENGIAFAALMVVHALLMYGRGCASLHKTVSVCGMAVALVVGYCYFRWAYIGVVDLASSRMLRRTENPQYFVPSIPWAWSVMLWMIQVKNLELLFFPVKLCCEYSYNCIPFLDSLRDPRVPQMVTVSMVALTALLWIIMRFLRRRDDVAISWILSLAWIVVPYLPVSHVIMRVGTFIAERCLYAPSIGTVLLITLAASTPRQRLLRYIALFSLTLLALFWSFVTYIRVGDWYDDETLFRSAIRVCPASGKLHYLLAAAIVEKQTVPRLSNETLSLFRQSYGLDREFKEPLYYLAVHSYLTGDTQLAYTMARECVTSPYTLTVCYPLLERIRAEVYPAMKRYEKHEDNALLGYSNEEKATQYFYAGVALATEEKDACRSATDLRRALHLWNASALFWYENRVTLGTAASFCAAIAWYSQSAAACRATDWTASAQCLRAALAQCDATDWADADTKKSAPNTEQRLRLLYSATQAVWEAFAAPNLSSTRDVRLVSAEAAVRRYCAMSSFAQAATRGRGEAGGMRTLFFKQRAELLQAAVEGVMRLQKGEERDEVTTLAQCAPEILAFVKHNL